MPVCWGCGPKPTNPSTCREYYSCHICGQEKLCRPVYVFPAVTPHCTAHQGQDATADVYIDLAAKIFGRDESTIGKKSLERKAGKIGELGLGYQMGKLKR